MVDLTNKSALALNRETIKHFDMMTENEIATGGKGIVFFLYKFSLISRETKTKFYKFYTNLTGEKLAKNLLFFFWARILINGGNTVFYFTEL